MDHPADNVTDRFDGPIDQINYKYANGMSVFVFSKSLEAGLRVMRIPIRIEVGDVDPGPIVSWEATKDMKVVARGTN